MKKYYILLLLIACTNFAFAQEFYVTTSGTSDKDGKSEKEAWNIEHAFATAKAGQTVWIKAGNYGNKNLVVSKAGNEQEGYINFIGYKDTPGDIISCYGPTITYGDALDATSMPLLEGVAIDDIGEGTGIKILQDYVHIENIQITLFEDGVEAKGDYNSLKNVIATQAGDLSCTNSAVGSCTAQPFENYSGRGFLLYGDNSTVLNCMVINAGAEGIVIKGGNNQKHSYNYVYSDNLLNATDYYYLITASDSEGNDPAVANVIEHVYVERVGALEYSNHGIVYKVAANANTVRDSKVVNTVFEHNFSGVYENTAENIEIIGGADKQGTFLFRNGAHDNLVKNSKLENAEAMATFNDKKDGFDSPLDIVDAGYNNELVNVMAENCTLGVNFGYDAPGKDIGIAHDNTFYNCSFIEIDTLFKVNRPNENNRFINTLFHEVQNLENTDYADGKYVLGLKTDSFQNCNFSGPNAFGIPTSKVLSESFPQGNAASIEIEGNGIGTGVFESDSDVSISAVADPYLGEFAIKGTLINGNKQGYISHEFTVEPNIYYDISFYAKKTFGERQGFLNWEGFENGPTVTGASTDAVSTEWKAYNYRLKTTGTLAKLWFYVSTDNSAPLNSDLYLDKISITKSELFASDNPASLEMETESVAAFNKSAIATLSTISGDAVCEGDYALKGGLSQAGTGYFSYTFDADIGTEYDISFFAKRNVAPGSAGQRVIAWQGFVSGAPNFTPRTEWTFHRFRLVANSTVPQLRFYPGGNSAAHKDSEIYIDALSIKPIFQEEVGINITSLNPNFVDEAAKIYRLANTSQLIDKGIHTDYAFDLAGHIRPGNGSAGSQFDIGTYEYTSENLVPSVVITSPCSGTRFDVGEPIWLESKAIDTDGTISNVIYKSGNTVLGNLSSPPYREQIEFNCSGDYQITAYVYDDKGAEVQSETITVGIDGGGETIAIPDARFEQVLIAAGYDSDGMVNQSICKGDALNIIHLNIGSIGSNGTPANLTGMQEFVNLESFKAQGAVLENDLDFSENQKLKSLSLTIVPVENIDVSTNTDLESIDLRYCYSVNGVLDLSQLTQLQSVRLFDTSLDGLNIKNGANSNSMSLDVQGSFAAGCIQVDDPVAAAGYSNWHKDSDDQYSLDCSVEWSNTTSLMPINDAFMTGNSTYNTNEIKAWVSSSRKGYLMYDLSSIDGEITKAELQFTVGIDGGFGMFEIFEGINDPVTIWDENSLNASNRPALGDLLGAKDTNYTVNSVHTIALDHTKIEKSPHYSLVLFQPEPTPQGNQFNIKSKEHVDNTPPTLIISYLPSSGTSLRARIGDTVGPSKEGMVFYPNPTRNKVYISGIIGPKKVTLMDLTGRVIFETTSEQHTATIDMQPYPSGMYLVKIKSDEVEKTFKVIKE